MKHSLSIGVVACVSLLGAAPLLGPLVHPSNVCAADVTLSTPSGDDIPSLVEQLTSDEFAVRQRAAARLIAAGPRAIPSVKRAIDDDGDPERSERALQVLRQLVSASDAAVAATANVALEELAKSNGGSAALRAADILEAIGRRRDDVAIAKAFGSVPPPLAIPPVVMLPVAIPTFT